MNPPTKHHQVGGAQKAASSSSESCSSVSSSLSSSNSTRSSRLSPTITSSTSLASNMKQTKLNSQTEDEEDFNHRSPAGKPSKTNSMHESVQRYRNSPFGLKHHYLTMPDDGLDHEQRLPGEASRRFIKQQVRRALHSNSYVVSSDSELSSVGGGIKKQTRQIESNKSRKHQDYSHRWKRDKAKTIIGDEQSITLEHDLINAHKVADPDDRCDLSVLASSSVAGSLSSPWPECEPSPPTHRLRQHLGDVKGDHMVGKQPLTSHFGGTSSHEPAGDVGIDAEKCNAKLDQHKSQGECYYETGPPTSHRRHHPEQLHKLAKLGGASPTLADPESPSLLVRFSSIMYATFLVILGCILHVSELRQKSKNSSDHIYTTIVALMGIIWLLFLQMDLQRYKRYASKYILIETIFNDHRQHNLEARANSSAGGASSDSTGVGASGLDPTARSTTSSSASLVNDRMSMNTEVIFKKTAYKMYQQRAAALDHRRQHHLAAAGLLHGRSPASKYSDEHYKTAGSKRNTSNKDCDGTLVPAYKFLHGKMGANFYLKCGMAAFCFGHVIHEGLRFGQQLYFFSTNNVHCRDSAALIAHLVTPLYSFYQLFMMFKYSNLVINRHKILARFGLMHIIGTSVTFWFRTIMEEAFEDFVHKMDYFRTNRPLMNNNLSPTRTTEGDSNLVALLNSITNAIKAQASERSEWSISPNLDNHPNNITMANSIMTLMSSPISATITPQMARHLPDSYACAQNTLLTTKSMNALPYLYPFTIEYNLLLAATFLSLYSNIGKIGIPGNSSTSCKHSLFGYANSKTPSSAASSPGNGSQLTGSVVNSDILSSSVIRMPRGATNGEDELDQSEKEVAEYKSNFVVNADCHSANKGLFCGFFVLLVTLVTIVIFFVTINKPTHVQLGIKINLIQEATLTALILIVTLAGFKQVVKLNRNPHLKDKVTTDDVLMLIPLPFFFIHSLLSFRAETASMYSGTISSFSSIILQKNHHQHDPITSSTNGNLQSILLGTNNSTGVNNSLIESRSSFRMNNILASNPNANGSNGRFVEQFISNTNINSNSSGVRISRNSSNNRDKGALAPNSVDNNDRNIDRNSASDSNGSSRSISGRSNSNNNSNSDSSSGSSGSSGSSSSSSSSSGSSSSSSGIDNSVGNISDVNGNYSQIDHFKLITVALNLFVMIEVLVQTNFIIDGMRRCSESRYLRFKKPGRELITFAIILNITYWIVATFETKSVEQYKTEIEYYGPLPYMFISHTTLPVMLFYRYHSSVCLAEIWNRAYKPPKKR